jgi:hypothetical protein
MSKTSHRVAIVIFSKLEGAGESAVYRALMFARELVEAGDDVEVIFDGAGTTALAEMCDESSPLHTDYHRVRQTITGACRHCARAYGVAEPIELDGVKLIGDYRGHASLRRLIDNGYELVTF